jgi:hypothetical protein
MQAKHYKQLGHFLSMVRNTANYIQFRLKQVADKVDNDGGHHKDDETGKKALEYGKVKDTK